MKEYYVPRLDYYTSLPARYMQSAEMDIQMTLGFFQRVAASCRKNGLEEKAEEINDMLQGYMAVYYRGR
ncbi:MAG: hypothetical protein U5K32_09420 [Bacteroidales bacterium]|nr:hypothetical protein [Bacteroidales bacterium]